MFVHSNTANHLYVHYRVRHFLGVVCVECVCSECVNSIISYIPITQECWIKTTSKDNRRLDIEVFNGADVTHLLQLWTCRRCVLIILSVMTRDSCEWRASLSTAKNAKLLRWTTKQKWTGRCFHSSMLVNQFRGAVQGVSKLLAVGHKVTYGSSCS